MEGQRSQCARPAPKGIGAVFQQTPRPRRPLLARPEAGMTNRIGILLQQPIDVLRPIRVQPIPGNIHLELCRAAAPGTDASWGNVERTSLLECVETDHVEARNL